MQKERGCVGDQPQPIGKYCDWLSAQSPSIGMGAVSQTWFYPRDLQFSVLLAERTLR